VAEAGPLAAVGREQSAEHADRRRLAAAVRSQEAEDLAAPHGEREILDRVVIAEVLVQAAHVDDDVASGLRGHFCLAPESSDGLGRVTSTG